MKKGLVLLLLSLVFGMCINTEPAQAVAQAEWTIGIYMCGSDLESSGAAGSADLLEIMSAKNVPDDVNIVIETGGSKKWLYKECVEMYYKDILGIPEDAVKAMNIPNVDADKIQRYLVKYDNVYDVPDSENDIVYPSLEWLEDVAYNNPDVSEEVSYMSDSSVLEDFVRDVQKEYPAKKSAVIFWNHGGGTLSGVCVDSYADSSLSLSDIERAFYNASVSEEWQKFDMIGFDACLMASFETMAVCVPYGDYMTASLSSEPGEGWEYTTFLEKLGNDINGENVYTGKELGRDIVDAYAAYYKEQKYADGTLGVYDLSKVSRSAECLENMAKDLLAVKNEDVGHADYIKGFYSEVGLVEAGFHLYSMQDWIAYTSSFASERVIERKEGTTYLDYVIGEKYKSLKKNADMLEESMFGTDGVQIYITEGEEESKYKGMEGVSIVFPERDSSVSNTSFEKKYLPLNMSTSFTTYLYSVIYDINAMWYQDMEEKVSWNPDKNEYTLSFAKDMSPYLYCYGVEIFKKTAEGDFVSLGLKEGTEETFTYMPGEDIWYDFNGAPVWLDNYYEDYYQCACSYNDERGTAYFQKREDGFYLVEIDFDLDVYGDEVLPQTMSAGDTIYPVVFKGEEPRYGYTYSEVAEGAGFIISDRDFAETEELGVSVLLPIKENKINEEEVCYSFYADRNARMLDEDGEWVYKLVTKEVFPSDLDKFVKAEVVLAETTVVMKGEEICPAVTVRSGNTTYVQGTDYEVAYADNVKTGTATVTITGIGKYEAAPAVEKTFTIAKPEQEIVEKVVYKDTIIYRDKIVYVTKVIQPPATVKIKKMKRTNRKMSIRYKKVKKASGYQIAYSESKTFKTKKIKEVKATCVTIKNLKKAKVYYVKVRAYKVTSEGKKLFGKWSKVKIVKCKKSVKK